MGMNWKERVERAEKAEYFTDEDKELAQLWVTGPISEIAHRIEIKEGSNGSPKDIYLILDGIYFTKAVEDDNIGLAVNCYKSIQKQVVELENGTDKITQMNEFLSYGKRNEA